MLLLGKEGIVQKALFTLTAPIFHVTWALSRQAGWAESSSDLFLGLFPELADWALCGKGC